MKKALLLAAAIAFAPLAPATAQEFTPIEEMPAGVYTLDRTHASLNWKVSHAGLSNYTARFTGFDASVTLNPQNITDSSVVVRIAARTIETDYPKAAEKDFNKSLGYGEEWFNAEEFPEIRFVSNKLERTGDNTGLLHGDLTLLGVTKPAVLDVTLNGAFAASPFSSLPTLGFSAHGTIKRSDWGFDTYIPLIGDEVEIFVEAEFAKNPG